MQIVAVVVFVVAMVAIMSEKVHRALVAIVGAMILLVVIGIAVMGVFDI